MKVFKDVDQLPAFKNAVITIGTFDGVHLGHRKIIELLLSEAKRVSGETVIITFHPHPRKIVPNRNENVQLLTTIEERAALMRTHGIDNLVIVPFTKSFSEQVPEKYVEEFLVARFKPAVVIIGYDHKFGKERQGDYKLLETYKAKGFFDLREIPQQMIAENAVSSTRIRTALNEGNVQLANQLLGYPFFFEGIVERGDQRGRTIGFPTANLQVLTEDKLLPANGVYAVEVEVKRESDSETGHMNLLKGMMNIGVRPTVDGTRKTIEINLFDFEGNLYGLTLRVHVNAFIREEKKFGGLDELKAQLALDRQSVLAILA